MTPEPVAQPWRHARLVGRTLKGLVFVLAAAGIVVAYDAMTGLSGYVDVQANLLMAEVATVPGTVLDNRYYTKIKWHKGKASTEYVYFVRYGFLPHGVPESGRLYNEREVDANTFRNCPESAPATVRYVVGKPQVSDIAGNQTYGWTVFVLWVSLGFGLAMLYGLLNWLGLTITRIKNWFATLESAPPADPPPTP